MKKYLLFLMVLSFFLSSGSAVAQIVEKSSDVSPYVGILKWDGGGSELMFGARYNYNMSVNGSIEASVGLVFPEHGKIYLYHANYRYNLSLENELLVPFFTGGVGAMTTSFDGIDGSTNLSINFGGGMQYFTSENLAIRIDVRDHMVFVGDQSATTPNPIPGQPDITVTVDGGTSNNLEFSGGITYYFI